MKIASAALQLDVSHEKQQHHEIQESIRAWRGQRTTVTSSPATPTPTPSRAYVQISDAGQAAQTNQANAIEDGIAAAENDPMLQLIRTVVAMLTGHKIEVFGRSEWPSATTSTPASTSQSPHSPNAARTDQTPPTSAGFALEYERHEIYSESEQTSFSATGTVVTADGQNIDFSVALVMSRSYHEESNVSLRFGDARQKKDPLVINFAGNAAQLSNQRFRFDLDADGQTENINFVASGSGFLALDRNGDGVINNGLELFGAKSGNGFAELSQLDADQNGWIDENDPAYEQLQVWTKDSTGKDQLSTVKQTGIGAINLTSVGTPFDLKNADNLLDGQIRMTSVFLHEDGKAGTIQQIDLMV